jgi:hypothetical protein
MLLDTKFGRACPGNKATASWWSRYTMLIPAKEERFETIDVVGGVLSDAWRSCRPTICVAIRNATADWGKSQSRVTASLQVDLGMKQPNTQTPPSGKVVHVVKNFNEFNETRTFVAVFTKARL